MSFKDGRVVSNFIVQALANSDITIYGDGKQTRSFCYVSDLIEGIISLINTEDEILGPINLGNPHEISVSDLANLIIDLTHSNSTISYASLPEDDPRQRKPDISQARAELKWEPHVKIEDGLKRTIIDFRDRLMFSQ